MESFLVSSAVAHNVVWRCLLSSQPWISSRALLHTFHVKSDDDETRNKRARKNICFDKSENIYQRDQLLEMGGDAKRNTSGEEWKNTQNDKEQIISHG